MGNGQSYIRNKAFRQARNEIDIGKGEVIFRRIKKYISLEAWKYK